VEEIMIVSPPLMSSTLTTISPMSDLPQLSLWSNPGTLRQELSSDHDSLFMWRHFLANSLPRLQVYN